MTMMPIDECLYWDCDTVLAADDCDDDDQTRLFCRGCRCDDILAADDCDDEDPFSQPWPTMQIVMEP